MVSISSSGGRDFHLHAYFVYAPTFASFSCTW